MCTWSEKRGSEAPVPLCEPCVNGREWTYVKECLDSGWVSSAGPFVTRFEREFAAYVRSGFAVATASGTAALHLALCAVGVRPGDEVLVSALTFVAPANAVRYCGAVPVFVDADPDSWQVSPEALARFLHEETASDHGELRNRRTGRVIRALLPVHILGQAAPMAELVVLAREFGLRIVEDASESLGTRVLGPDREWHAVGTVGDVGCFSFNGNKLMTTGGGGMVVTADRATAETVRHLSTQARADAEEYVHDRVGFNYRLTNLQAAVGVAQLECLDRFVEAKCRHAASYGAALSTVPGIHGPETTLSWSRPVPWLYTVRVDPVTFGMDARALRHGLRERGIESRTLWQPLHLSPAHRDEGGVRSCPVAERLYSECLSLPSSVGLEDSRLVRVTEAIRELSVAAGPGPSRSAADSRLQTCWSPAP
jgi:perosamine synthetase